ncbi:MAG: hypothetical protein ABIQ38_09450, partial [Ilumatobacteraceae bacterium]
MNDHDSRLALLRLRTLVASHQRRQGGQIDQITEIDFPLGSAGIIGSSGWVLVLQEPRRGLGPALLWMNKHRLKTLHLIVETSAEEIARRAQLFALEIRVWSQIGNDLVAATPAPPEPRVHVPDHHLMFQSMIELAGATVVCEHGVLAGEVIGLEVCRVIDDPRTEIGARLEIGVGVHDRELFQMVNGISPTIESLTKVVQTVLRFRQANAIAHPLNRLGAERFFREVLIANPQLVGARHLTRAEPPVARANLKESVPCVALDKSANSSLVVVCSAIVDPDLVSFAADARLALQPDADLVLAVAPSNVFPSMTLLANSLHHP